MRPSRRLRQSSLRAPLVIMTTEGPLASVQTLPDTWSKCWQTVFLSSASFSLSWRVSPVPESCSEGRICCLSFTRVSMLSHALRVLKSLNGLYVQNLLLIEGFLASTAGWAWWGRQVNRALSSFTESQEDTVGFEAAEEALRAQGSKNKEDTKNEYSTPQWFSPVWQAEDYNTTICRNNEPCIFM